MPNKKMLRMEEGQRFSLPGRRSEVVDDEVVSSKQIIHQNTIDKYLQSPKSLRQRNAFPVNVNINQGGSAQKQIQYSHSNYSKNKFQDRVNLTGGGVGGSRDFSAEQTTAMAKGGLAIMSKPLGPNHIHNQMNRPRAPSMGQNPRRPNNMVTMSEM